MITWHLEIRKLKELKKHPKNPRRLTKEQAMQLEESLNKFGVVDVPVINTDNTIIGGHQRITILKRQNFKEVSCWVPDHALSPKEVDELNIRLNRGGSFDYDILANEFEIEDLVNWGFTEEELLDVASTMIPESEENIQETKELPEVCEQCGQTIAKKKKKNKN